MGRKSTFNQKAADEIVRRLSEGEPLAVICRDEHMPGVQTVYDWRDVHAEFAVAIARARDEGFDAIANHCLEIADRTDRDWEPLRDDDGNVIGVKVDGEHIQRAKLMVDTRLKLLAKWDPKRYGDKVTNEHTGPDGGPVQVAKVERVIVKPNS